MGTVISSAAMSLDGFIAHEDDTPGALFDWYENGDNEVVNAGTLPPFHLNDVSAARWRAFTASLGVLVVGRRLFDLVDGWQGKHPLDVPVVVLTHTPPTDWSYPGSEDFTFVTTGIADAVAAAQAIAGERVVGLAAGTIATQALEAGLLDEVHIDLVPLWLGAGRRYFTSDVTHLLGDPTSVVPSTRVTHLRFPTTTPADR